MWSLTNKQYVNYTELAQMFWGTTQILLLWFPYRLQWVIRLVSVCLSYCTRLPDIILPVQLVLYVFSISGWQNWNVSWSKGHVLIGHFWLITGEAEAPIGQFHTPMKRTHRLLQKYKSASEKQGLIRKYWKSSVRNKVLNLISSTNPFQLS